MSRTILVPLDGSPAAEHALPWAISLAQLDGALLHLLRVHQPPAPVMVGSIELAADFALEDAVRNSERQYLEEVAHRLRESSMVSTHISVSEGAPADAIQEGAAEIQADLIVMSTHGRGALARLWLGSVADQIVRDSTVPTLMIRPAAEQAADLTARPLLHRLVVPLDGSELAEQVIESAVHLGKVAGADYMLVMVVEAADEVAKLGQDGSSRSLFKEMLPRAEAYLEQIAERLRRRSCKVETKILHHSTPAKAILNCAAAHGNAVIALATRGHGGIRRMILGSTADKIIRGATMPVLVYHPKPKS